jgi:hypothetical protein
MKHEPELNTQEASLYGCRATKRKVGRLIEKIYCKSAVAVAALMKQTRELVVSMTSLMVPFSIPIFILDLALGMIGLST